MFFGHSGAQKGSRSQKGPKSQLVRKSCFPDQPKSSFFVNFLYILYVFSLIFFSFLCFSFSFCFLSLNFQDPSRTCWEIHVCPKQFGELILVFSLSLYVIFSVPLLVFFFSFHCLFFGFTLHSCRKIKKNHEKSWKIKGNQGTNWKISENLSLIHI